MEPALGNWYNPEGDFRPPWAGLSLLDLLEQFRKRIVRCCVGIDATGETRGAADDNAERKLRRLVQP